MLISVDYESYYDDVITITKLGIHEYPRRALRELGADDGIYLVQIRFEDGRKYVGHPRNAPWAEMAGHRWCSHNASFDEGVHFALVEAGIIPAVYPQEWICTADLVAWIGVPRRLAESSKILLHEEHSKAVRSAAKGRRWSTYSEADRNAMLEYGLRDADLCLELARKYLKYWPDHERLLSQRMRFRQHQGIRVDVQECNRIKSRMDEMQLKIEEAVPWSQDYSLMSIRGLEKACQEVKIPVPSFEFTDAEGNVIRKATTRDKFGKDDLWDSSNPEFEDWEEGISKIYPLIGQIRQYRKARRVQKLCQTLLDRINAANLAHITLKYFGAHTGRSAGEGGFNLQNLPRSPYIIQNNALLSSIPGKPIPAGADVLDIRGLFIPRDGCVFIDADLSNIEPRCLAWLARDEEFLNLLRQGMSPYEAHARLYMGWTGGKLKDENENLYNLAKVRVLALGYGCGWQRFIDIASTYGVTLTPEDARTTVYDFRANPFLSGLWSSRQDAMEARIGGNFTITLPSGREMFYAEVDGIPGGFRRIDLSAGKYPGDKRRRKYYGGKLVENETQAFARDVFFHGVNLVEQSGIPVLFTVHDQLLAEVPEVHAREALEFVKSCLRRTPEWAPGLPVDCTAKITHRFSK